MKRKKQILLVGGGSGGHIYPLLAIADYLVDNTEYRSSDIQFVIADNDADYRYLENTEYAYTTFSVAKLRRYFSWENFRDVFRLIGNIFRAFIFLIRTRPEKIFSKGGFVSLPFGLAAFVLRIPFYLHETDSAMGLSNALLSHVAKKVFTGFPSHNPNHLFVGNPVRAEFFNTSSVPDNHSFFSDAENKTKIFIFGGSQGAVAINAWAREFFAERGDTSVVLVAGKGKKENIQRNGIVEYEFLTDGFLDAIQSADIIITRAGGSIAELSAAKKCIVLIPLPSAANDHQRSNARYFSEKNAALWIEERDLYDQKTTNTLNALIESTSLQSEYATNLSCLAQKDTLKNITAHVFS